jgi:hypothetical protein
MPNLSNWISAARQKLVWFGGIYAIFVLILALPGAQTQWVSCFWVFGIDPLTSTLQCSLRALGQMAVVGQI